MVHEKTASSGWFLSVQLFPHALIFRTVLVSSEQSFLCTFRFCHKEEEGGREKTDIERGLGSGGNGISESRFKGLVTSSAFLKYRSSPDY